MYGYHAQVRLRVYMGGGIEYACMAITLRLCLGDKRISVRVWARVRVRVTHQTDRAVWLFEVPQVGYIDIDQPEMTNLTITSL